MGIIPVCERLGNEDRRQGNRMNERIRGASVCRFTLPDKKGDRRAAMKFEFFGWFATSNPYPSRNSLI